MTSHSDGDATDNDSAAAVGTVGTVGDGVSNGAVAAADDTVIDGTDTDTDTVKKQNFHTGLDPVSRTNNSAQPTEFNSGVTTADKVRFAQSSALDTGSSPVWSAVAGTVADADDRATDGTVGDGNVPSAAPTDMFSLDSRFRGNDGAVVVGGGGDVGDRAVVVGTVATVGGGVGNGAVATVTVTNPDDATIVLTGNHPKSSFPRTRESRTNHSAQPTEFNAAATDTVTASSPPPTPTATNNRHRHRGLLNGNNETRRIFSVLIGD